MLIKYNREDLDTITSIIDKNNSDLNNEIEKCIKEVENIKVNFDSPEVNNVLEDYTLYLEKLKLVPIFLDLLSKKMKKAGNIYYEKDSSFQRDLQKENEETYDENPN